MYIKSVKITNLQSIKSYTFEFPATGLVVFTGQNNNGKSILTRITKYVISGGLSRKHLRKSIINRESSYGEAEYIRDDGTRLIVHVAKEASLTYISLIETGQEPVLRYLADKSYRELPIRFGFHYNTDCDITLNIGEADENLLFYKTKPKVNSIIIEEARTDKAAQVALDKMVETQKECQRNLRSYRDKINANSIALNNLKFEDVEPLRKKMIEMQTLLKKLQNVYIPTLPVIRPVPNVRVASLYTPKLPVVKPVPDVKYMYLYKPKLPEIRYPRIVQVSCNLPDITQIVKDLEALKNNVCPTCGRGFV